ncbi:hypothetical protein ABZP36_021881 [Zizania latifolia]
MCLPFLCGGDDHGRPRESSPVGPRKEASEGQGHMPRHANGGNGYASAGTASEASDDVPSGDQNGQKEDPSGKTDPTAHPEQARVVGDVAGAGLKKATTTPVTAQSLAGAYRNRSAALTEQTKETGRQKEATTAPVRQAVAAPHVPAAAGEDRRYPAYVDHGGDLRRPPPRRN